MKWSQLLFIMALFAMTAVIAGADSSLDPVESKVKDSGLKYRKDEDGDLRVTFDMGGGRTQLVFVNGQTESFENVQYVEIWSIAALSESRPVNAGQMRKLLNGIDEEVGHWCLKKPSSPGQKWSLYYSVHLSLSASAKDFEAAIRACGAIADDKENDLLGTDDF